MRKGGYDSYRGRSPFRTFLKVIIILLVIVLLLTIAGYFFLQQYLVYSSEGVRLDLPFLREDPTPSASPAETAPPTESEPLVVLTPEVIQPQWLHAVLLPNTALYDDTAQQQVSDAGGNAAIFDMKADDGSLGYVSQLNLAISAKASSGDPAVNAAIRALNQTDLYTVARVSCFKDHNLSGTDRSLAITTNSGYRWTDPDGIRWVSPTNETVRQYVADVCVELAELGFDEILLDNCGYPTQGNLNYIKKGSAYDKAAFADVIGAFYAQVVQALEPYDDVKLSVMTDGQTVTAGQSELSGQTMSSLLTLSGRIWLRDADETAVEALSAAGVQAENAVLPTVGTADSSWADLTRQKQ